MSGPFEREKENAVYARAGCADDNHCLVDHASHPDDRENHHDTLHRQGYHGDEGGTHHGVGPIQAIEIGDDTGLEESACSRDLSHDPLDQNHVTENLDGYPRQRLFDRVS